MSRSMKISKENEFKYIQLGLNVAYYRKLQGLTQEELAEISGISRSHISAIEAPNIIHNVSLEVIFDLAAALKTEPYKLLEFRD
ncbi:MAG: helix-turn-helix transcriptional regulator [Ruminococcus sp.]|uniref:helix-turn-helix domain-containing protein n=1 Tax=Ruminococcus flavefaciens TaxID=1265 RepID=UPI0026EF371B|nr:helix-turn-helix transcriptional regulator [Ruminococcus flavefaciens]MBR0512345.1 helix-turn-helix transcriptional regulator [Ruminococcus sp.]